MKSLLLLIAWFLSAGIFLFSCTRELSCESCEDAFNKPPLAKAGPDQIITLPKDSAGLDGSASSDPDGTITSYKWIKISGPVSNIFKPDSSKTLVKTLVMGIYQFELTITDNGRLSAKDTVQITVQDTSQPNRPPIANAGIDQTIALPNNAVIIDGGVSTDPDNNITTYLWSKISGPSSFNIANANSVQTQVTNLVQGTYQFELKVTDAIGLFAKDTMQVIVSSQLLPCTTCKIVFVSSRDGNEEIYSCNADGSNIQRLTNNAGSDVQPAWSPDGTLIVFISDRTGNSELYIMNADGSNVVRKTFLGSYSQDPTWSPDGTKIAFSAVSNGSSNIWVVGAASGSTPMLLFDEPGRDEQPAWSPDGTKIALVSDWAAYDFVYDIYTINANGTGFSALNSTNIFDYFDYLNPSWSPSGTKLAMAISETIGINQYNTQIGVINANGSGLTPIVSGAAARTKTSWSADGSKIAYTSLSGSRKDISWVSANGAAGGTIVTNAWDANWQH